MHLLRRGLVGLILIFILINVVRWGGTARPGPLFWVGVATLIGLVLSFGFVTWWFLWSPLRERVPLQPRPELRQFVVFVGLLSGTMFIAGATWDEIWHRRFGALQDDFLWAPHLLIYTSLALITLFTGLALWTILRGPGSIRARFRSELLIGLLALVAAFLLASLPSDELWHRIYAKDLTAWSLPHLTIVMGFTLIMGVTAATQLSLITHHGWRSLRGISWRELIIVWLFAIGLIEMLQVGILEWDNIARVDMRPANDPFTQAFLARPQWLYPVVIITISMWISSAALWTLQRPGVATLVALGAFGFRIIARSTTSLIWDYADQPLYAFFFVFLAALLLDIWYLFWLRRSFTSWMPMVGALLTSLIALSIILPLINRWMLYPPVNSSTIPWMLSIGILMALGASWLGQHTGLFLRRVGTPLPIPAQPFTSQWKRILSGTIVTIAFVIFTIIITASPPNS